MNETQIRERLHSELDAVRGTESEVERESDPGAGREPSAAPTHPADEATMNEVNQSATALESDAEKRADSLVAALRRLDDGTYGFCVTCGRPIGEERLEARPDADRCLPCQTGTESSEAYDQTARRAR